MLQCATSGSDLAAIGSDGLQSAARGLNWAVRGSDGLQWTARDINLNVIGSDWFQLSARCSNHSQVRTSSSALKPIGAYCSPVGTSNNRPHLAPVGC